MPAQTNVQLLTQLINAGADGAVLARLDAAYRFLIPLFAHRFRADGRPFLAHLCGTASLAAEATRDGDTILAALLHAVFAQGGLARSGGATPANRARVEAVAGSEALALVLAYDRLAWNAEAIRSLARSSEPLDPATRAALIIRLANEAEEHAGGAMAFSAKSRYAGKPDLLNAIDALDARLGGIGLARRLREGLAAGERLAVPASIRRADVASFDVRLDIVGDVLTRVRRRLRF